MFTGPRESQGHDNNSQKVYPQPIYETANQNKESIETLVSKMFYNISSLKAAYIQLQDAHTPYDSDKIQGADKLVVEELIKLSQLKHSYRDNPRSPTSTLPQDSRLATEIQEQQNLLKTYEVMVNKFQSQIQNRDTEIIELQQQIQESNRRKLKLLKKLKHTGLLSEKDHFFSVELTPDLFSSAVENAYKSIHDFSIPLLNMMKAAGWDLDAVAHTIEPAVIYWKRAHKKYAFESHICKKMFSGFQEECFSVDVGSLSITSEGFFNQFLSVKDMDPQDMLSQSPDSFFGKFCRQKYLMVMHQKMEDSFFGNLDQRDFVMSGGHPRTSFYQAFLKLAKSIWLLHRLAYSFHPKVEIFQVKCGREFSEVHMESIVKTLLLGESEEKPKVGLMMMPGFMVGESVIRSRVYLSGVKCIE